jgi:glycosyltransferase involved in cell wall biosynthesis
MYSEITCPRISIITPSFNQGHFIEETILSLINQNYPNLEYIIIDGGSTDNTIDIIKKYEKHIDYWVSEPDNGQSHAINKGFKKATGVLGNWICSDDLLCENALNNFIRGNYYRTNTLYLGKGYLINEKSEITKEIPCSNINSFDKLVNIPGYWRNKKRDSIMQQSALFPLDAFIQFGGLCEDNYYTMDFELWGRLLQNGVQIKKVETDIGMFRWYIGQKTSFEGKATRELIRTAKKLLIKDSQLTVTQKAEIKKHLNKYLITYNYHQFRSEIGVKRRMKKLWK